MIVRNKYVGLTASNNRQYIKAFGYGESERSVNVFRWSGGSLPSFMCSREGPFLFPIITLDIVLWMSQNTLLLYCVALIGEWLWRLALVCAIVQNVAGRSEGWFGSSRDRGLQSRRTIRQTLIKNFSCDVLHATHSHRYVELEKGSTWHSPLIHSNKVRYIIDHDW